MVDGIFTYDTGIIHMNGRHEEQGSYTRMDVMEGSLLGFEQANKIESAFATVYSTEQTFRR